MGTGSSHWDVEGWNCGWRAGSGLPPLGAPSIMGMIVPTDPEPGDRGQGHCVPAMCWSQAPGEARVQEGVEGARQQQVRLQVTAHLLDLAMNETCASIPVPVPGCLLQGGRQPLQLSWQLQPAVVGGGQALVGRGTWLAPWTCHTPIVPDTCPPGNSLGSTEDFSHAGPDGCPSPQVPSEALPEPPPGDRSPGHVLGCPPRK